ncbi:MAG: TonB-dependent receptor [Bacteroidales bacterium]|nr:TonB-dependent receptor [Bacteroidales bacterium]
MKNLKHLLLKLCTIVLLHVLFPVLSFSQPISISGSVTDETGSPLIGVNVVVKGSTRGTVTDSNGRFQIEVPSKGTTLVFSYVGYASKEMEVSDNPIINVTLKEELSKLEEVVVIGYGTQKKKLTTGANVHVSNESIEKMHSLRVEQALQGSTPGVLIVSNSGQPGENVKVRIRGVGTVGNSDPIYIVDGIPVQDISYLNPSDIESVDVLKDAASAAIYGTRAANGVILISTKKAKEGTMNVNFDAYYGVQNAYKKLEMLNAREYCMIINEAYANAGRAPKYSNEYIDSIGEGTNWMDYLFTNNAPMKSVSININKATEKSSYSSSVSYYTQNGIIGSASQSRFDRISARFNNENKILEKLSVGQNLVYSYNLKKGLGVGDKYNNVVRSFANATPIYPAYDYSRPEPDSLDHFGISPIADESNPLASMNYKYINENKQHQLVGNVFGEIELFKDLKFKSDLGIDLSYRNYNEYRPYYFLNPTDRNAFSYAIQSIEMNFATNFENTISYSKIIGNHQFNALLGNTFWNYNRYYVWGKKEGQIFDDLDHAIIDNGTVDATQKTSGTKLKRVLLSYFGRLNYNFAEKYLFSFTFRRDGSSRFGPENRWGNFPSLSAGWIITQEEFFKINGLDFLKIRASWGQNGNDQLPDFLYEATLSSQYRNYYFGTDETQSYGTSPENIQNPKLKWETSEQTDLGFDARFLKYFFLTFDIYDKKTKDWLVAVPVPDIVGAGNNPGLATMKIYKNGGDVQNRGFEVSIGYQRVMSDFSFRIEGNCSYNKNKVTSINNPEGIIKGDQSVLWHSSPEFYRAQVGYPIGYFYGYKTNGIFQTSDADSILDPNQTKKRYVVVNQPYRVDANGKKIFLQNNAVPGDIRFVDLNGDTVLNEKDMTMLGSPWPDYTFGLNISFAYKGLDLSITAQGVYGNEIAYNLRDNERDWKNYTKDILNRWHGDGTSNRLPRVTTVAGDRNLNSQRFSDLMLYDGSYLKIRSINLGYDLSHSVLKGKVKKCRIYIAALNVWTMTKYPGMDPEVGYGNYDPNRYENFSTGIDIGYYPIPMSFLAGLQLTF